MLGSKTIIEVVCIHLFFPKDNNFIVLTNNMADVQTTNIKKPVLQSYFHITILVATRLIIMDHLFQKHRSSLSSTMADNQSNSISDKCAQASKSDDESASSTSDSEQDCCRPNLDLFAGSSRSNSQKAVAVPDRPVVSSMAAQGFFGI